MPFEKRIRGKSMPLFESPCVFRGFAYYNHMGIQPSSALLEIRHSINSKPDILCNNSFFLFTGVELQRMEQDHHSQVSNQKLRKTNRQKTLTSNRLRILTPKVYYFHLKVFHRNTTVTTMCVFGTVSEAITSLKSVKL